MFVQGLAIFPLTSIAPFWSQFQQGLSASKRVFALIDAEPRVVQQAAEPVAQINGEIAFRHLRFVYNAQTVVLPDFSLHIAPGQSLAVVDHALSRNLADKHSSLTIQAA